MNTLGLIKDLKELKTNNDTSSYQHVKELIYKEQIMVPYTRYQSSLLIRYRRHTEREYDVYFQNISDLSYRKDITNINRFGRANEPNQGFFYCNDDKNESTGIAECTSVLRGNHNSLREVFTVGAWELKRPLILANIVIQNYTNNNKPLLENIHQTNISISDRKILEHQSVLLDFIAKEFSNDSNNQDYNYYITSAFANYVRDNFPNVDGILYSSVQMNWQGRNIVLWPNVVDKNLKFKRARKLSLRRVNANKFIQYFENESEDYNYKEGKLVWKKATSRVGYL